LSNGFVDAEAAKQRHMKLIKEILIKVDLWLDDGDFGLGTSTFTIGDVILMNFLNWVVIEP
jgi:hypothetical protein